MVFLLNDRNILSYLTELNLFKEQEVQFSKVEAKVGKNFNLLIHLSNNHLSDNQYLLVKQEPHDREGETKGDFLHEWKVHQLLRISPELQPLLQFASEPIYFDPDHAIVIANYLHNYCDLSDFYSHQSVFPVAIAANLGRTLANFHQATLDRSAYQQFLESDDQTWEEDDPVPAFVPDVAAKLEQLTPEIFGQVSEEGLKFYALYQRYESLRQAIDQLQQSQTCCCLTHQDLKFNNILLYDNWQNADGWQNADRWQNADSRSLAMIRLIDWEKWAWGDPASDLGMLIAEYLKIWLKSLGLRSGIDINLALQLAGIPLEHLQPSIVSLTQAYLATFPAVLDRLPDFLPRVIQFTGLALIESIQAKLYYREPFGNTEIGILQVAKTLLCTPQESIRTVFGMTAADLLDQRPPRTQLGQTGQPPNQSDELRSVTHSRPTIDVAALESALMTWTPVQMLEDLIQQIQIRSTGVYHPHYPFPDAAIAQSDRLQRLPTELQQHYLRTQLRNLLYDLYFSSELRVAVWREATGLSLENHAVGGLNIHFLDEIQRENRGTGCWDAGWQVLRQEMDGRYTVCKDELTLYINPQDHLSGQNRSPQLGNRVAIRLPNHRMDGDFYVAVGEAGLVPDELPTLELWFHVTPEGAKALMHHLTTHLNEQQIPV